MLEDIKILLSITDDSKDNILNIYIRRAIKQIIGYKKNQTLINEAYVTTNYSDAVVDMVVKAYQNKGKENVKSQTQGERSITYSDGSTFIITDSIENLIGYPYLKMM
jgi:hypothetical protein